VGSKFLSDSLGMDNMFVLGNNNCKTVLSPD